MPLHNDGLDTAKTFLNQFYVYQLIRPYFSWNSSKNKNQLKIFNVHRLK